MTKSTASAGPVELHSSPSTYYLWEFPEKPVSVRLSLDVVDRLERDVLESFRAITARGSEVGGVLLGRAEPGDKLQTIVENYELFHCDYTRGPLYLLSDEEKTRLEDVIRRKNAIGAQAGAVVGFFRSNTRKDLSLDDEDLGIYQKYFSRPEDVFLLVKPFAAKPSAGGIFIWEGGRVRNEGSYIEFPFRRSELGKGQFAKSIVHDAPKPKESPVEIGLAPPVHKTGARAPVLPFSLKRDDEPAVPVPPLRREERAPVVVLGPKPEEQKPVPAPVAPRQAEPAPVPIERKAPPAAPAVEPIVAAKREEKKPEKKPEKKVEAAAPVKAEPPRMETPRTETPRTETPAKKAPAPPVTAVASTPEPLPKTELLPARSVLGGKKLWALFGGLAMLGMAAGSLYYLKSHADASKSSAVREAQSFQLKAEPSNGQLLVSWNYTSEIIRTARSAVLSISDGPKTEDVPLDLTQLRAGSIMYSPLSADVSFRLEVRGATEGKSRSEFVRVPLAALPSQPTASSANSDAAKPAQTPQQQAQATDAARVDDASLPAEEAQPPQHPATPPKPFSLAARIRQAEPADLPEAPGMDASGSSSVIRPALPSRLPAPPAAAPAVPPAAPSATPPVQVQAAAPAPSVSQGATRVGGKVQEPKLLRRVEAIYPPMARQARVSGIVRLQATIGKDGKIKKLQVLNGPPLLKQAAIDAVQKWVYSPSLLNGTPVESTTDVDVNFNLNSR